MGTRVIAILAGAGLWSACAAPLPTDDPETAMEATVRAFEDAYARADSATLRTLTDTSFRLVEVDWSSEPVPRSEVLQAVGTPNAYRLEPNVEVLSVHTDGQTGWVVWLNDAVFLAESDAGRAQFREWGWQNDTVHRPYIVSAVLGRHPGGWKVGLAHATAVTPALSGASQAPDSARNEGSP